MFSRPLAVAAFAVIAALALGAASSAPVAHKGETPAAVSTVTLVSGSVAITHAGGEITSAREGDLVSAGDTIRTDFGGAVEITYVEGTSVRVESRGEVVVAPLADESRVSATIDRAWQAVTKLLTGSTRYEVRGPSATASVRG